MQKTCNNVATNYVLHGNNVVHLTHGSNTLHFFYDAQNSPAVVEYNGVSYGYVKNLQGDIIAIVNASGTKVVEYVYDAWGKLLSKTGSMASTLGTLNPFRYRGYVYDEETGLYYLRSRYYNPNWCRFINADNVLFANALADNIYTYCANHPIGRTDKNGQNWLNDICNAISNVLDWVFPGNKARVNKMLSGNATIGDTLDWLTMGYTSTVYRAFQPEKPLSLQHWADSFTTIAIPFSAFKTFIPRPSPTITWPAEAFNPLVGTQYSQKVLNQMGQDKYHGFPTLIDTLATYGDVTSIVGGDGIQYSLVRLPGFMNDVEGFFEYIIGPQGIINHRFFNIH